MIKLFVFNSTEKWTTQYGYAVFAEDKEAAVKTYTAILEANGDILGEYSVKELEIKNGLALHADGYDQAKMVIVNG